MLYTVTIKTINCPGSLTGKTNGASKKSDGCGEIQYAMKGKNGKCYMGVICYDDGNETLAWKRVKGEEGRGKSTMITCKNKQLKKTEISEDTITKR